MLARAAFLCVSLFLALSAAAPLHLNNQDDVSNLNANASGAHPSGSFGQEGIPHKHRHHRHHHHRLEEGGQGGKHDGLGPQAINGEVGTASTGSAGRSIVKRQVLSGLEGGPDEEEGRREGRLSKHSQHGELEGGRRSSKHDHGIADRLQANGRADDLGQEEARWQAIHEGGAQVHDKRAMSLEESEDGEYTEGSTGGRQTPGRESFEGKSHRHGGGRPSGVGFEGNTSDGPDDNLETSYDKERLPGPTEDFSGVRHHHNHQGIGGSEENMDELD